MRATPFIVEVSDEQEKFNTIKRLLQTYDIGLSADTANTRLYVVKSRRTKGSIGMLIAEKSCDSKIFIKWLYVKKIWRRLSVASQLIQHLEHYCKNNRICSIATTFDQHNNGMNALTGHKHGWSTGEGLDIYTFNTKKAIASSVTRGELAMQKRNLRATILPLSECNKQEIIQAAEDKKTPRWAQLDDALLQQAVQELSRVFYYNNCLVGWLITIPSTSRLLDYRILWVDREHRHTGIMVKALAEVMRAAHLQNRPYTESDMCWPWETGFFMVHSDNQGMVNWVTKRLSQDEDKKNCLIYREKLLAESIA